MPCVNLANTRTHWSSVKNEKKIKNNTVNTKITEQNTEKVNEPEVSRNCEKVKSATGKRNAPIRRMQFGVPLMTHQEIKQARQARRAERLTRKQNAKNAKLAEKQAIKDAKLAQKQVAKAAKLEQILAQKAEKQALREAKAARRLQRKLAKQAARAAKNSVDKTTQPATAPVTNDQKDSDEPILLCDGDVIKIHHVRKPLNLVYEPTITTATMAAAVEQNVAQTSVQATDSVATSSIMDIRAVASPAAQAQHVVYVPSLRKRPSRAELINAESRIGSQIFGPIPAGHRREFFHHQRGVWIWHEGWTDGRRQQQELTVRYEVRLSGIYKKVAAGKYLKLEGAELTNFRQAAHTYLKLIKSYLYQGVGN